MTAGPITRPYAAALEDANRCMASVTRESTTHPDEFKESVHWRIVTGAHRQDAAVCRSLARYCAYEIVALMQRARDLEDGGRPG